MDGVPIFSLFPLDACDGIARISRRAEFHDECGVDEIEKANVRGCGATCAGAGIAETDPTADLDGWDAAVKLTALAIVLMGADVKLEQVKRTGIRELSEEKIRAVRAAGMRYKLVCRAERKGDSVQCCVQPECCWRRMRCGTRRTSSAIRFDLDMFGLSIVEHNPGIEATAYGCWRIWCGWRWVRGI